MRTEFRKSLKGEITVGSDKSISHRSLIISSLAIGKTEIYNMLEGEDVLHTKKALNLCGVKIERDGNKYVVQGVGILGLNEPQNVLDMGNSGTSTRLLMGLLSPYDFNSFFCGDLSLSRRTMARVILPLCDMGARFFYRSEFLLPALLRGSSNLVPISYKMQVPSAQVKSAILLAGVQILGTTIVQENEPTRDHTEKMLKAIGADVVRVGNVIKINGGKQLSSCGKIVVPGDPSSAAFFVVAALICPDSEVLIKNVCINQTRTGLFEVLKRMGGNIEFLNITEEGGEPVADIFVKSSVLNAIEVEPEIAPRMIDEYPILAIAASFAKGRTKMTGLFELVVKESNRLKSVADGLLVCGVKFDADYEKCSLEVEGSCGELIRGTLGMEFVKTNMDHRIAMSFLIAGLASKNGVQVDSSDMIKTSFPNFFNILNIL